MPTGTKGNYEMGYGEPPVHSRFKKGQSGNPRGPRWEPAALGRAGAPGFSITTSRRQEILFYVKERHSPPLIQ
jgi:hypothetical protein